MGNKQYYLWLPMNVACFSAQSNIECCKMVLFREQRVFIIMPAVLSHWVHLARVSGESGQRRDWVGATLYTLAESSQFWRTTRGDSQARHETLWLEHHGPLKKRDLNKARHERRGYTRGFKVSRVFPSTFSLSPCLVFPQWECTAGITHYFQN